VIVELETGRFNGEQHRVKAGEVIGIAFLEAKRLVGALTADLRRVTAPNGRNRRVLTLWRLLPDSLGRGRGAAELGRVSGHFVQCALQANSWFRCFLELIRDSGQS
jgi:hypothetical protein